MCRPPNSLLIVDDHPIFGEAIQAALQGELHQTRVEHVQTLGAAAAIIDQRSGFDLVLLDLRLPDSKDLQGLIELRARFPRQPIAIISASADAATVQRAEVCGAAGFIPKSASRPELVASVRDILRGKSCFPERSREPTHPAINDHRAMVVRLASLTSQQLRVLRMLRAGMLNKQIAGALGVGETTAKFHVGEILRKLGVASRTQAVIAVAKLDPLLVQRLLDDDRPATAPSH